jgi:HAE1 family hydrophobic/amphiphilic exporter-1
MFLSDISIKRPIMISMFLIVFVLFGGLAYFDLNLELTPKIDLPVVTIQTIYGGASPREIETQVTKKIEDAVSPISGIDYIQSYSMENISLVMVAFNMDKDIDIGRSEIKDKIDGIINDLPEDSDLPIVQKFDITALPVVNMILRGPQPITELYDYTERHLKDRLSQIPDVGSVIMTGGQQREIRVEIDSKTVLQHSISLPQLARNLAAQNLTMPGGTFELDSQDYSVRMTGEFEDIETIRNTEIPTSGGMMKMGEVAVVSDMGAKVTERTTFFNNVTKTGDDNVIQLGLVSTTDGNPVNIYRRLQASLPEIRLRTGYIHEHHPRSHTDKPHSLILPSRL